MRSTDAEEHEHEHEPEHDPLDLFEDALLSIFDERMPAAGDPGQRITFSHANLPTPQHRISYHIPDVHAKSTHLFAHHQWDSGVLLARMIAASSATRGMQGADEEEEQYAHPAADVRKQTVVELGAGTGLPGLVAGLMGAESVVITDYDDPPLIQTIKANIATVCRDRQRVNGLGLTWGCEDHVERAISFVGPSRFTRVLAADTLWVSSAHVVLLQSMRSLLGRSPDARILMLAGFHTGRPAIARFFQLAAGEFRDDDNDAPSSSGCPEGQGWALVPDWEDGKYGGIWERRIDGQTRPWQGVRPKAWSGERSGMSTAGPSLGSDHRAGPHSEDEEMGDIGERAKWIVCASLRWLNVPES